MNTNFFGPFWIILLPIEQSLGIILYPWGDPRASLEELLDVYWAYLVTKRALK